MPHDPLLLTPGPVAIPAEVAQALARPVIPHRSAAFASFYQALQEDLRYLFQASGPVAVMTGTGTQGMCAAIYSLFRPGDRVLVISAGKFSRRWADYAAFAGLQAEPLEKPWGQQPSPAEVLEAAARIPGLRGVVMTHCETSTGALLDLEETLFALRAAFPELLTLADVITTAGISPLYVDAWGLDAALCAQKGFMNPSGLCCLALSERGRQQLRPSSPADVLNWHNYVQAAEKGFFPYTAPVNLLYGMEAALGMIRAEGLPGVWNRTRQSAERFRAGIQALGGTSFPEQPADALTVFSLPGRETDAIRKALQEQHGVLISGGQDALSGKVLRVSHMGLADAAAMDRCLVALREVLGE
jgi:aspartate aminotransferase-like enzyme